MEEKKKSRRRLSPAGKGAVIVGAVCVAGGLMWLLLGKDPLADGKAYLARLDKKDVTELSKQMVKKRMDEYGKAMEEGRLDIFSLFHDYVFLGDSRVVGFDSYGLLEPDRVFAGAGYTINNVDEFLEQIKTMQPSNVYVSYGVNDLGLQIGYGADGKTYGQIFEEQMKKIEEADPQAQIVVNGIIAPRPDTIETTPTWGRYTEVNEQLQEVCKKNGWIYVDNSVLDDGGNADIYQGDGVHFLSTFYPIWAQNIINTQFSKESQS